MKTLIFFLVIISCIFLVRAQEKPDKLQSIPFDTKTPGQKYDLFKSSPLFKLPAPEAPSFTDSLGNNPRYLIGADNSVKDVSDYFNMPVMKPGPAFSSNMPIMVPDTSVHYYIRQMRIEMNGPQPEGK